MLTLQPSFRLRRLAHGAILLAYLALLAGPAGGFVLCTDNEGHVELELVNGGLCVLPSAATPDCAEDSCGDCEAEDSCCLDCTDVALDDDGQLPRFRQDLGLEGGPAADLALALAAATLQVTARQAAPPTPAPDLGADLATVVLTL